MSVVATPAVAAGGSGFGSRLAAPARLLGLIRDDLAKQFQIAGTASKDLTKVGDHDLAKWLKSALFAAG